MKKLIYGLGAVASIVTPVVAVVSCGSKDDQKSIKDSLGETAIATFKKQMANPTDGDANTATAFIHDAGHQKNIVFNLLDKDQTKIILMNLGLLSEEDSDKVDKAAIKNAFDKFGKIGLEERVTKAIIDYVKSKIQGDIKLTVEFGSWGLRNKTEEWRFNVPSYDGESPANTADANFATEAHDSFIGFKIEYTDDAAKQKEIANALTEAFDHL